jgi:hypothetical protein
MLVSVEVWLRNVEIAWLAASAASFTRAWSISAAQPQQPGARFFHHFCRQAVHSGACWQSRRPHSANTIRNRKSRQSGKAYRRWPQLQCKQAVFVDFSL